MSDENKEEYCGKCGHPRSAHNPKGIWTHLFTLGKKEANPEHVDSPRPNALPKPLDVALTLAGTLSDGFGYFARDEADYGRVVAVIERTLERYLYPAIARVLSEHNGSQGAAPVTPKSESESLGKELAAAIWTTGILKIKDPFVFLKLADVIDAHLAKSVSSPAGSSTKQEEDLEEKEA